MVFGPRSRGRLRAAPPRVVLVAASTAARQHPPADPAQRRSAGALEVPQDPRPAVRAEADGRAGSRHHRARQPLHRRVRRPRRVQLHRGVRRAVPVVGVPRADGPARGTSSTRSCACATASCTRRRSIPNAMFDVDDAAGGHATRPASEIYDVLRRTSSTHAREHPTDDILSHFLRSRSTARSSRAKRSSTSASCSSSPGSTP